MSHTHQYNVINKYIMDNITYNECPPFKSLVEEIIPPGWYDVKILRVCDGDTVWAAFQLENECLIRHKIRLRNIDTAELRTGNKESRKEGKRQRLFVKKLIDGKIVKAQVTGLGDHYRCLAFIFPDREMWEEYIDNYDDMYTVVGGVDGCMELNEYMLVTGRARKMQYSPR